MTTEPMSPQDREFEATKNRIARELQAMCNQGAYGTCMAIALCIQLLRIIFTQTKQPPALVERVARAICTPGTNTDFLTQRPS
jgi:hypothetical protein